MPRIWREDTSQKVWLWIGLVFFVFYTGEACLFWGPNPRVTGPPFIHLAYWGVFGAILIGLISGSTKRNNPKSRWDVIQSIILGTAITAAVIGIPALIIGRTQDITLGHAVLLFTISLAAIVIGAMSFNLGWFLAGCVWALAGCVVLYLPQIQDYLLGAVVAIGFCVVGVLRKSLVSAGDPVEEQ
jgi:hypothetical protein